MDVVRHRVLRARVAGRHREGQKPQRVQLRRADGEPLTTFSSVFVARDSPRLRDLPDRPRHPSTRRVY